MVRFLLSWREIGDFSSGKQFWEYPLLKRLGSIGQLGKVSQQKHPFVKMTFELIKGFVEFGQFDVDEFKLFVEDFAALIF